ncbi:hypothetical protein Amet_2263 [Alkaliphilus metalliredigens QYMF]|uniref:Uncharacterized protein n=2 Tax=Alkaliphilus TaxID=114627 RepID=A6TQF3_ALKMQ|nr:hypothetical protein Amet_2263 [Alkaliphilus metalliredigens QYMF]
MRIKYSKKDVQVNLESAKKKISSIVNGDSHELIKRMTEPYVSRIEQIEKLNSVENFKLNFVGSVGLGKSTALCHITNLVDLDIIKNDISKLKDTSILKTGSGRTTLCETTIRLNNNFSTFIKIEKLDKINFEKDIEAFCAQIIGEENEEALSREVFNVIVNMSSFPDKLKKSDRSRLREEYSKDQFDKLSKELLYNLQKDYIKTYTNGQYDEIDAVSLFEAVTSAIDYDNRSVEYLYCPEDEVAKKWLKEKFNRINSGLEKHCPYPKEIVISVNSKDVDFQVPQNVIEIIDSKGLDGKAVRTDVQDLISSEDNIVFLCNGINDYGNILEYDWLKSVLVHNNDINHRCFILGLEKGNELELVNNADGDRVEGMYLKQDELKNKFNQLVKDVSFDDNNMLFYNAFRGLDSNAIDDYTDQRLSISRSVEDNIRNMYHQLNQELKGINESLEIFKQGRITEDLKDKLLKVKIDLKSYMSEVIAVQNDSLSKLPQRVKDFHAGVVRASVNRNGNYDYCNIYSECSQIGSDEFTNTCHNLVYSIKRNLRSSMFFDINDPVESAVQDALIYKIEQEYINYEKLARRDYYNVSENKIAKSTMWSEARLLWGRGSGNYKGEVIKNITNELEISHTEETLKSFKHAENYFRVLFDFIDSVTQEKSINIG